MKKNGIWGGELELQCAADLWDLDIYVYEKENRLTYHSLHSGPNFPNNIELHLQYIRKGLLSHYNIYSEDRIEPDIKLEDLEKKIQFSKAKPVAKGTYIFSHNPKALTSYSFPEFPRKKKNGEIISKSTYDEILTYKIPDRSSYPNYCKSANTKRTFRKVSQSYEIISTGKPGDIIHLLYNKDGKRIPFKEELPELISLAHKSGEENYCHHGIHPTYDFLNTEMNIYWKYMFKGVTEYCNNCVICLEQGAKKLKLKTKSIYILSFPVLKDYI